MKRSSERKMAPGVWSAVGGKLETHEINDPQAACFREIEEETGITAEHIFDLKLHYVIIRRYRDTLRQTYISFGGTDAEPTITTDEGELHWIHESELLNREYTKTIELMLRRYLETTDTERVVVGVAENESGQCHMSWTVVEDFEMEV
jgi:8-oxo-dGTP diphosphatase